MYHNFLQLLLCATLVAASPQGLNLRDVSQVKRDDHPDGQWSKGKQVGVIVGCVVGGGIILFLWGWLMKGNKMWHGEKILWARSHFSFTKAGRQQAMQVRLQRKIEKRREVEAIWGKRGQLAPKNTAVSSAQQTPMAHLPNSALAARGEEGVVIASAEKSGYPTQEQKTQAI